MKEKLNPCQFKQGCFGCCGNHFETKEGIKRGMNNNKLAFLAYKNKREFLNRQKQLRSCGICYNLGVQKNGKIGCLVYNINGNDYRAECDCEINHKCKTLFIFENWDMKKQKRFKAFVEKLDIDWYDFGIKMDNGTILAMFLKEDNKLN